MKSPTLFGYTSKEKKRWFCALLFVCLSLSKPAAFFGRALSGKTYTFLLSALSRKMSSFYCSYPFSLRIKQKLRRMSSNTGEDVKLCGVCVLAASEKEKTKGCI